jgi:site-specific DNA recombinase
VADGRDKEIDLRSAGARRKIADCDVRLRKYRKALEAGADPAVISGWMAEVKAQREASERMLRTSVPRKKLTKAQVRDVIASLGDIVGVLSTAESKDKTDVYQERA